ncbi:DUF1837 domain-containing protein [Anaerostipes caccae]|uniref:HamA C-terminal domain-containing protein n=1 Tax=Anaerostipes caccae TaxID=105841 RepID=UPI003994A9C2
MELSLQANDFLGSFDPLWSVKLDEYGKNCLNLFILKINSNEFDYDLLINMLVDPLIDFSISRVVKDKYSSRPGMLSKKAREKFVEYTRNNGELGELLLFCFLETHLGAPKVLTKLELKTSTSHYVNGADGVHFLKLDDGNYQLIFGESKTYIDITQAITDAFKSIYDFKNGVNSKGNSKSGISYEKSLISDNLFKETFTDDEKEFLEKLIYPSKQRKFEVDDAFGIFIGFQITVTEDEKALPSSDFRELIKNRVKQEVEKRIEHISKKIVELKLQGHNFYIYVLPFTDIDAKRKKIIEEITK